MSKRDRITKMLQESPDDVFLNYSLAMELAKEGAVAEASAQFARVRELDHTYVPAYFQEGQMLAGAGQTDQAREILKEGMQVAQRIGDTHALGEMAEFVEAL